MSGELALLAETSIIPAMNDASIAKVRELTDKSLRELEQFPFITRHRLHAGQYFRIVTIPASDSDAGLATGVLVKRTTILIVIGDHVTVYMGEGEEPRHVNGWQVLLGSAGRKQAFLSKGAFTMIMSFATNAETIAEAEAEFTDEIELLWPLSDTERHDIIVTGE